MFGSLTTPIGKIFQPLLDAVGSILAFFYSIIPNYPVDVALLTIVIMALLTPITVKSTKSMAALQALSPEMKKLQQKYKGAENRAVLNEEMMKLYKEHKVSPASGCLPMLLQLPAFFILYSVIRGITNTVTHPATTTTVGGLTVHHAQTVTAVPRYIPVDSKMHQAIVAGHGQLNSFGMNFADKLLSHHSSVWAYIPFLVLALGSVGLQYVQMSRLNKRNPGATQANPQAAALQKYMPLIFGFIYINVAAILNVYFIISSAIRVLTQEIMFRKGLVGAPPKPTADGPPAKIPAADRSERALPRPSTAAKSSGAGKGGGAAGTRTGAKSSTATSSARGAATSRMPDGAKSTSATRAKSSSASGAPATKKKTSAGTGSGGSGGGGAKRAGPSTNGTGRERSQVARRGVNNRARIGPPIVQRCGRRESGCPGWRLGTTEGASAVQSEAHTKGTVGRGVGGSQRKVAVGGEGACSRPARGRRGRRRVRRADRAEAGAVRSGPG